MIVRVASRLPSTEAEGPGRRFALWVQGCSIRCAGCCNPHYFPREGGARVEVSVLAAELHSVREEVEGITLLGGEPFEQAEALAALAGHAREMGLSVMTFTGYTLEELRSIDLPGTFALLSRTDLLVDGRYEASLPETGRRWAGSSNQRFHHLTGRYRPGIERIGSGAPARTVEVRLTPQGDVHVNGWPELVGLGRRGG